MVFHGSVAVSEQREAGWYTRPACSIASYLCDRWFVAVIDRTCGLERSCVWWVLWCLLAAFSLLRALVVGILLCSCSLLPPVTLVADVALVMFIVLLCRCSITS